MSLEEKITLMVNSLNSQKKLVDYESIDALVRTLMEYYNSEIKDIRKDIENGSITDEILNNKLDKGGVSTDYNTAKKIEDKIKEIKSDIDSGTITVSWNSISGKPNSFPTAWSSVTDKPSSFSPSVHNQSWTTITDKPTIFPTNWGNVDGKPSTFPPDSHTHPYLSTSGGTVNGNLTVTGQIVSNGDVTAFSDRELKENIQPLKDNFLDKLQVYSYNYIGEKDIRYGVIAQELQEFYPNLVLETDREVNGRKVLAVRDRDIIYLLLDAYQKLSKRVSELERGE
ncbi:MAG: tail fiber domain-containing protein [Fusobacterium sp.]|uniref:tail fiber domain-containing protein n=1 Tax=Fusobacterium sp. TaxID=68766 RepID=UPI002A75DC73|nr:tail fiber domain-containing protein [Fusobacterium sp.]MDY3059789.1 tail fiber domain-containing protein [Fusobacterium sp.]